MRQLLVPSFAVLVGSALFAAPAPTEAAVTYPIVLTGQSCVPAIGQCGDFVATLDAGGVATVSALGLSGSGSWSYNARKKLLKGEANLNPGTVSLKGNVNLTTQCIGNGTFTASGLSGLPFPVSGTFTACRVVP